MAKTKEDYRRVALNQIKLGASNLSDSGWANPIDRVEQKAANLLTWMAHYFDAPDLGYGRAHVLLEKLDELKVAVMGKHADLHHGEATTS
jgi:hypothetical protein